MKLVEGEYGYGSSIGRKRSGCIYYVVHTYLMYWCTNQATHEEFLACSDLNIDLQTMEISHSLGTFLYMNYIC